MPKQKKIVKKVSPKLKTKASENAHSDSYHHGDLKPAIINAALEILKTTPPENLSLREIARKLGVSQTAPYRHFKSKEEILAAISQQGFEMKLALMKETFDKYKDDPKEIHYACADAYFKMAYQNPQHYKLMFGGACIIEDYPELMQAACVTFAMLSHTIKISQEKKIIGPGDPYIIAMNYWSVVNGFTSLYVEKRLDWLGVTEENVFLALRNLIDMIFEGSKTGVVSSETRFRPFQDEKGKEYLEQMKQIKFD